MQDSFGLLFYTVLKMLKSNHHRLGLGKKMKRLFNRHMSVRVLLIELRLSRTLWKNAVLRMGQTFH